MHATLVTNSVDTDQVEERTIDGDRHLVAKDVVFIRPMRLAGGYVPSEHVANSAPEWDGVPLTVAHPRTDSGMVVSAETDIGEAVTVGHARNPSTKPDGSVAADLAVNVERAAEIGGEAQDIVAALEAGDPLEVSSQYFADALPDGVYDGQHRANVEGYLDPDSIALLPNQTGVCSLPECGFAPDDSEAQATANTADDLRVPVANADDVQDGDRVIWPSQGDRPAAGFVREVLEEGRFDTELGGEAVVTAPAALIRVVTPSGDEWEPSSTMVAHKLATLTVVDEFPDPDDPTGARPSGSDMHGNASADGIEWSGTAEGDLDESEIPNDDYASHYVFDADTKSASSFPLVDAEGRLRRQNVTAAFRFRDDAPDTERLLDVLAAVNEEFDDPPIDPESLEEARGGSANSVISWGYERIRAFLGDGDQATDAQNTAATENEPAEPGADAPSANAGSDDADPSGSDPDMDRETLIDEITANSNHTAEELEDVCDTGVQKLHDAVVSNDDGGDASTDNDSANDEVLDRLEDLEAQMVTEDDLEEAVANAATRDSKRDIAETIVANSAEYDDAETVLEDYPTEAALEAKRDSLGGGAQLPGSGTTANASVGGDDDDFGVDAGVLTE